MQDSQTEANKRGSEMDQTVITERLHVPRHEVNARLPRPRPSRLFSTRRTQRVWAAKADKDERYHYTQILSGGSEAVPKPGQ
ncbi:hypothetical protein E2C01_045216 [Portunus trituberculatus]|uniref:Uncharacterized protein n=1 Tax=Portunus trituberculatus TaxID=210409 RepID=A0A5B7FXQ3_PORTR|nr:hypothetical protein [Portunus trituberculatus]